MLVFFVFLALWRLLVAFVGIMAMRHAFRVFLRFGLRPRYMFGVCRKKRSGYWFDPFRGFGIGGVGAGEF
jgi:hypothetical protein